MNRRAVGRDSELTARMFLTMTLLAVVYLAFVAVLLTVGVDFIFVGVFAAILIGIQYFSSDKLALAAMRAKVVTAEEAPKLHEMVERLSVLAGIPKPRIAIADLPMANAFATGRSPKKSVIAVTTGIMNRLSDAELEAVLAHELTHITNRDVTVITLASFFATIAAFIMQNFFFMSLFGGMGRRDDRGGGGGALMVIFLASILVYFISYFLIRTLSRYREYAADRGGAILTGQPGNLASALMKLNNGMGAIPKEDLRRVEEMNAFFIIPALKGGVTAELGATHPPLQKRIERLEMLQREMEGR